LVGLLGAAALSALLGWLLLRTVRVEDDVVVIAHRGAAGRAPENTLAPSNGRSPMAPTGVRSTSETADGEVVVLHDSDFMKIADSSLKIWAATYDEVRKLDAVAGLGRSSAASASRSYRRCWSGRENEHGWSSSSGTAA
jgi:glycerophosphoryl diester phosphodiesterase